MKNLLQGANEPLFYSMTETCTILKLSRRTLATLVEKGAIKAHNIGLGSSKVYRFTPESIYDFINGINVMPENQKISIPKTPKLNNIKSKTNPFARV
jgi:hypothetical protein